MRFFAFLVILALMAGIAYWAIALRKPAAYDPVTGQAQGATVGGMDPGASLNNARGAAQRIQDEGFRRAAEADSKTAP